MLNESRLKLIERLKKRFEGNTEKFNVHFYKGVLSGENESLILFSEFLKKAIEGLDFILANSFDNSNQYKMDSPLINVTHHIYISSILFYSKMFRGGKGVKRENILLKEKSLFDSEGKIKLQQNHKQIQPKQDRFYIEEYFMKNSNEFKIHHEVMCQMDKNIGHLDKTDLTKCYTLLLFDKKKSPNYLGIDNHYEYFQLPSYFNLNDYHNLFKNILNQVNNQIYANAKLIHEEFENKTEYSDYYKNLLISEDEI